MLVGNINSRKSLKKYSLNACHLVHNIQSSNSKAGDDNRI